MLMVHALFVLPLLLLGCSYPTLSADAYDLTSAAYSASLKQSPKQMRRVAELVESATQLSKKEREWLTRIVQHGQAQRWQKAADMSRDMLEDQIVW